MSGLSIGAVALAGAWPAARPALEGLGSKQNDFASLLNIEDRRLDAGRGSEAERARSAAEDFVAQALVKPVLSMIREHSQAAEPFAPTRAEKAFGGLMDEQIARGVVRASNFPLVDRLAQDLMRGGEGVTA